MPSWKKVITSGSNAELSSLFVANAVTASTFSGSHIGPLTGTASWATTAINSITASVVKTTPASGDRSFYVAYLNSPFGEFQDVYTTASFTYNPVSQSLQVTASRAISSSWAGVASSSYVTSSDAASTENHYLTFVKQIGNTGLSALSGSSYDVYISPQSGYNYLYNVTSLGEHWGAVKSYDAVDTDNKDYNVLFANTQSAVSQLLKDSSGSYRYNPTRKTLIVTNVSASSVTALTVSASAVTASTTLIGTSSAQAFTTTLRQTNLGPGNVTISGFAVPTASYDSLYFRYTLKSGSDARGAGFVFGVRSGSIMFNGQASTTANNFDSSTNRVRPHVVGGNLVITGSFTSGSWELKGIIEAI